VVQILVQEVNYCRESVLSERGVKIKKEINREKKEM
jgi:hypothetical protein